MIDTLIHAAVEVATRADDRDEAVADCELFSELLIEQAKDRHPSQTYGGGNLRVVR